MRSPTRAWPRSSACGGLPRELITSRPSEPRYWTAGSNQQLISRGPPDLNNQDFSTPSPPRAEFSLAYIMVFCYGLCVGGGGIGNAMSVAILHPSGVLIQSKIMRKGFGTGVWPA
jgi:hypothetical protein